MWWTRRWIGILFREKLTERKLGQLTNSDSLTYAFYHFALKFLFNWGKCNHVIRFCYSFSTASHWSWLCLPCSEILLTTRLAKESTIFLSLTLYVCMYVCNAPSNRFFFLVSRWNRATSWPSVLHDKNYKMLFFEFWFVAMATKFGLFLQKFQIASFLFSDGIEPFFCH